jgi:acyl carrier protein
MNTDVEARLLEIIATELQVPLANVVRGISLRKKLGMDSVAAVNIVFAVEEEFGIRVPETELEHVDSVEAILALLDRLASDAGQKSHPFETEISRSGRPG